MRLFFLACLLLCSQWVFASELKTKRLSEVVFYAQHSAPASVLAKNSSQLSVNVSGLIQELLVDVGDRVEKNAPLLRLDDFTHQQAVLQSEAAMLELQARIAFAEYQQQQAQRLGKSNNISEELQRQRHADLLSLQAQLMAQRAQHALATRRVDDTTLLAPFSGVITERMAQLGQFASPGAPLLQLLSVSGQQVSAELRAVDMKQLANANELKLEIAGQYYALKIEAVLPQLHAQQRTQQVRLTFTEQSALAGSSGRLLWRDHRAYLPAKYLQRRNHSLGFFVLDDNQQRFIELSHAQEGRAVRLDNISLDSLLVIHGAVE